MERERAILILYYGVLNPTDSQIAQFALFGEDAPFLKCDERRAHRMNTAEAGGNSMKNSNIEDVLIRLKGTYRLLAMLCDEPWQKLSNEGHRQEALFRVEELLKGDIEALEEALYAD